MFKLPDLPYDYKALEPYIDSETMHVHHGKHHAAYVDNLNKALEGHEKFLKMDILELLQNLDEVPEEIRTKVRNNGGGHANHTMFWKIMRPSTGAQGLRPSGELEEAINKTFGGLATFQEKFSTAGLGRFGSGWVWLVSEKGKLSIVDTPNQDTPIMEGKKAILGLDVWEHAYYKKYGPARVDYIKAWWNIVNWTHVAKHFEQTK